jgi:cyclic pyranopterin phosphate synthase
LAGVPATVAVLRGDDPAGRSPGREVGEQGLLEAARLAGLGAAKRTAELIPLCHPLPLSTIEVDFELSAEQIEVFALTATVSQTGVEMEALVACAVAGVTLLGFARRHDPLASFGELTLWDKRGGRSGHWQRDPAGVLSGGAASVDRGDDAVPR